MPRKPTLNLNKDVVKVLKESFELKFISLLIEGYHVMLEAGEYQSSREEENLTAVLIKYMKRVSETFNWKFDISPEYPLYNAGIQRGEENPRKASRIDIRLVDWNQSEKLEYFIEAKNLAQHDWVKPGGARVDASKLKARYIGTGIDNFVKGNYPPGRGCLTGYVVQGDTDAIVRGINKLLLSKKRNRTREILKKALPIDEHPACYRSEHTGKSTGSAFSLHHILLKFS